MKHSKFHPSLNFQILFLIPALLLLPSLLFSEINRINLKRTYPALRVENRLWLGTPNGLYQYNPEDDAFKKYALPAGRGIRQLYFSDEWLWCVLDSGLAALHLRLNEWLFYDTDKGLPDNTVNGLAFQGDYVWIATNKGAARFDLLIEEWEIYDQSKGLPEQKVNDIFVSGDQVWFIGPQQFSEYNPDFEKWRHFQPEGGTPTELQRAFAVAEEIWLVSDRGLIRFNPQLQTQQQFFYPYLRRESLLDILVDEGRIWAITRLGLFFYEQSSGIWREFEGNRYLSSAILINSFISSRQVWILTDQNVLIWDRAQKKWDILDYASGLSGSRFESVFIDGEFALLMNRKGFDYRTNAQAPWRRFKMEGSEKAKSAAGRRLLKNLLDNESGGYIPIGKYRWRWNGTSITHLRYDVWKWDSVLPGDMNEHTVTSGERIDVKSQLAVGDSRAITGFYNNVDYSETMYGLRYKSRRNDLVQEINWGDFRRETGSIPFAETASLFGSNIWMQAGPKTPRFKRSRVTLKAQTGGQRSRKTYEYYQGARKEFRVAIRDIDYLKNQFYAIADADSLNQPEDLCVFIDDLNPFNNTPNTAERRTIAGVTGDFDQWKAPENYYFYRRAGLIRFQSPIQPNWTVVVTFLLNGRYFEAVLQQQNSLSTARKNIYFLGARKIIPYSFRLDITDAHGVSRSLQDFGLDEDGDGLVDSQWIDYENGLLLFPQPEPFPPAVYATEQPQSFFTIHADIQTELSLIQLQHRNLVRGSEKLRLDGTLALGGNDYVLDYTNGTLIFVREGVVNSDTRIEIEYEFYTNDNDPLHSASLNWSPSDQFYVQGDWLQFKTKGQSIGNPDSTTDLMTLHSEMRKKVAGLDVRFIPGVAYHPDKEGLAATSVEALVSSSRFRLQTEYQNYSEEYRNIYQSQFIFGRIRERLQVFTTADVLDYLRLTGEWVDVKGFSGDAHSAPTDQSNTIGFLFHKSGWPGWQFDYKQFKTRSPDGPTEKAFARNYVEYQLPEKWSRRIGVQGLKMEGLFRSGEQNGFGFYGSEKQQFRQGFVRVNSQFTRRIQGSFFYRRNALNDISRPDKTPISRAERLLVDFSHEEWRTLQLNLRAENYLNRYYQKNSFFRDASLRQFSQINFRLSPGQLWSALMPLYFEINLNQSLNGWGQAQTSLSRWIWQMQSPKQKALENVRRSRNYYFKNEFRPNANWLIYSSLELNRMDQRSGASQLTGRMWRWNEKADIKLGFKTRVIFQYRQLYQNQGYSRTVRYQEPSGWIEQRWTPDFQNIFNLLYRRRTEESGGINNLSHNWEMRLELIWRKYQFWRLRRIEARQSFSGNRRSTTGHRPAQSYQFTSSSSLDLYPLHSMIIRLRLDLGQYLDELYPELDYGNISFHVRISLRF